MSNYKFLYYLAAIGEPNLETKLSILKKNLFILYKDIQQSFDIMINCYDTQTVQVEELLYSLPFLRHIIIHKQKGRLVELWKTNPYHNLISNYNYNYILYILDDVLISSWNMSNFIYIKNKYSIQFLSPKVLGGTWDYMRNQDDDVLAFANKMEIFCLLLNKDDFQRLMNIQDIENTYTWGVDLLLGHFEIKSAIYFQYSVNHMLISTTNPEIAGKQMDKYILKYGFSSVKQIDQLYPAISKIIHL
jgi:hypothetical protein